MPIIHRGYVIENGTPVLSGTGAELLANRGLAEIAKIPRFRISCR